MALDAVINRKRASWWGRFVEAPNITLARTLYARRQRLVQAEPIVEPRSGIAVVCVSDTHNSQPCLPPGDVLIHAGDLTQTGTWQELQTQIDWLNKQPHAHKIVIAGNHDILLDPAKAAEFKLGNSHPLRWGDINYLQHSSTTLVLSQGRRLTIYGHPSTRRHGNWAFQYDRGIDLFTQRVDYDADILVTHGAPKFHLDVVGWGEELLLEELWRVQPALHIFGHIHEGYGSDVLVYDTFEKLYERVCARRAGLFTILHMALILLYQIILGCDARAKRTRLVNASAVGGLLNEHKRAVQIVTL